MRKHRWLLWLIAIGWLPVLFWFKNPKQTLSEVEEPLFAEAQQCLRTDRTDEAFQLLNRLVEKRSAPCPETHFQLGQLSVKSDPIGAIYHFQRYLSQTMDGARSKIAMQLIETAKKEFARTLPLGNRTAETPEYCLQCHTSVRVLLESLHVLPSYRTLLIVYVILFSFRMQR